MSVIRPVEVNPLEGYKLWLRYQDGTEGVVDLSNLSGRGVFKTWSDREAFEAVCINDSGALEWPGGLDLCGDALYLRLSGKSPEEVLEPVSKIEPLP